MEPGHSIARNPDGLGYDACYNCHADTVRLGQEPITYFRKQPWVMNTVGAPEAVLPASHLANNTGMIKNGSAWNCNCHGPALVHNGTFDGPWPLHNTPEDEYVDPPVPGNCGNGVTLYAQNCAICHGALDSSAKRNRTEEQIEAAISTQTAMAGLKGKLSNAQLAEIACALSDSQGTPAPDGAALYNSNCTACHGALASSAKTGATFTRIKWGLANVPLMSATNLQALTDDEIHAISHALGGE
jgi:mono/diheme cytochrome c family protein